MCLFEMQKSERGGDGMVGEKKRRSMQNAN